MDDKSTLICAKNENTDVLYINMTEPLNLIFEPMMCAITYILLIQIANISRMTYFHPKKFQSSNPYKSLKILKILVSVFVCILIRVERERESCFHDKDLSTENDFCNIFYD